VGWLVAGLVGCRAGWLFSLVGLLVGKGVQQAAQRERSGRQGKRRNSPITVAHPNQTLNPQPTISATTQTPPRQISTLAALAYHKSTGRKATPPNQRLGFAENFLYMLDANGVPSYRCVCVCLLWVGGGAGWGGCCTCAIGGVSVVLCLAWRQICAATGIKSAAINPNLSQRSHLIYSLPDQPPTDAFPTPTSNTPMRRPNPRLARALEIMFVLHMEHEMNCSTAAARHLASRWVLQ